MAGVDGELGGVIMELDPEQFTELLRVLGTEPKTNLFSAANLTAIMSVVIAATLGLLAWIDYDGKRRAKDADFVFQSDKDYGALLKHLVAVGDWEKQEKVRSNLEKIDILNVEHGSISILTSVTVPEDIWEDARSIKTHFKSIAKLHEHKVVSEEAIRMALDHWGYHLLMGTIRQMDVYRFYHARRKDLDRIDQNEFDGDFNWYQALEAVKSV